MNTGSNAPEKQDASGIAARKRLRKTLHAAGWLIVSGFFLFNFVAYMHAYRMTHFTTGGTKTSKPEALSPLQKIKVLLTGVTLPKPLNDETPAGYGMPYSGVAFAGKDQTKLSAWHIPGQNETGIVLMFHGYGSCKSRLLPEAKVFHELGWNVLMTDFRGSGDSDGYVTTIGLEEANDVAAAVKWARERYPDGPHVLFGASMGSAAILRAIDVGFIEQPEGIIMECPYDRLLTTVKHRFEAMKVPSFPAAQFLVFWGGIQHGFNGFGLNPVTYARSVTCPALVLHGTNDPRVKQHEALAVCLTLRGPKTFHIFNGPGHESYCVSSPDEYRAVLSAWLTGIQSPP